LIHGDQNAGAVFVATQIIAAIESGGKGALQFSQLVLSSSMAVNCYEDQNRSRQAQRPGCKKWRH
jgi:hypothetical protein